MITLIASKSSDEQNEMPSLEPGTYNCTILRADHETSKKGTPQLALEVDIYNPVTGRPMMVKHWVPVTQKAVFLIEQLFSACGKKFGKGESISVDERWLTGKKAAVVTCIRKSENGGRYTSIIRFMNPSDVSEWGPLSDEKREYYCILPDGTREARQKADSAPTAAPERSRWMNTPAAPATGPQPGHGAPMMPNEEDDDIPF